MKKPFEILFNDDYLVVLNKIAKVLIQPSPKKEKYTLTSLLKEKMKERVFPCHRLDRETTGLIIYAKDKETQREVMQGFKTRGIKKKYIAFIKGRLIRKRGVLAGSILDKEGAYFGEKSKEAMTIYKVLKEFRDFSIVQLEPLTGRTNQLRIQLAKLGNPILGERKYAFRRDFKVNFKRLALHSFFIEFIHPISKEKVSLKIDLPEEMKEFIRRHSFNALTL